MAPQLPPPSGVVTFVTDFGTKDPYVGVMKGAVLQSFRETRIIDITHEVPAHDVEYASLMVRALLGRFPSGTVHVCVVDPGVGTDRLPVCVAARGCYWIGPDNGVFRALFDEPDWEARQIDRVALRMPEPSATFHGRDLFAPVAGRLARAQLGFRAIGPRVEEPIGIAVSSPGRVAWIDHFGNLVTDIPSDSLAAGTAVRIGDLELELRRTYGDVAVGEPLALIGSFDTLEIAVREGRADALLGVERGAPIELVENHQ